MPRERYAAAVRYLGENAKSFEEIRIAAAGLEAVSQKPSQATQWVEQITGMRNAEGTFGKGNSAARETGSALVALLRLGGEVQHLDHVLRTLKTGQRPDGAFGKQDTSASDLETTYRVLRAFFMLHEAPDDAARCRAFVASCRNADGGYGVAPGQPSSVAGTYYASMILHWLQAK
jgi:hypothetical protein